MTHPDLAYRVHEGLPSDAELDAFLHLYGEVFGHDGNEGLRDQITRQRGLMFITAHDPQGRPVAFKVGYEDRSWRFYSWLGGVLPEHRGQGVASALMRLQHAWCLEHGYREVRTTTMNRWRDMLILNLKHGFDVIGLIAAHPDEPKILLQKTLTSDEPA